MFIRLHLLFLALVYLQLNSPSEICLLGKNSKMQKERKGREGERGEKGGEGERGSGETAGLEMALFAQQVGSQHVIRQRAEPAGPRDLLQQDI